MESRTSPQFLKLIESCGISEVGCVRPENEDRILTDDALGLYVLADGMGGQKHGEIAAEIAISTVRRYIESSRDPSDVTWPFGYAFDMSIDANRLNTAIRLANRQVWHYSEQGPEFVGMGTTVAALLLDGSRAVIANVGDTRVYLFRAGVLSQLTIDDTWIASLSGTGLLAPEEARRHPMRNVLTQAAGAQEAIDVHLREQALLPGDSFLLSSDGLHGVVEEETVVALLQSGFGTAGAAESLIRAAYDRNAPDNVSVILLNYDHRS